MAGAATAGKGGVVDDLTESLGDIDWMALYDQVVSENEHLRLRIVSLRESRLMDVAYWWQEARAWLDDPNNRTLLILVAMPLALTLIREAFNFLRERK